MRQIPDHPGVHDQHGDFRPCRPARHLEKLDRDIHPAGEEAEPFGPLSTRPEAVCLDKTDRCVEESEKCHYPEPAVSDMIGEVDEYPRIMTCRIEMEMPDQLLDREMEVLVHVCQQSESGDEDQGPFSRLKNGYDVKAAFCRRLGGCFDQVPYSTTVTATPLARWIILLGTLPASDLFP